MQGVRVMTHRFVKLLAAAVALGAFIYLGTEIAAARQAEAAGMAEGALEDLVVPASAAVTLAACVPVTSAECV